MGVRILTIVCALLCASVAVADPYTFYRAQNDLGQPLTWTAHESPREACEQLQGSLWSGSPLAYVRYAEYFQATGQCVVRTEADAIVVGQVVPVTGTCPGDVRFSFELQQCVDVVTAEQQHAVLLSGYLWMCLIGGLVVGYRFGS